MNLGFLNSARFTSIIIIKSEPKTPVAASKCWCICVSGKTPTIMRDKDAKIPRPIPSIRMILLQVCWGFHEYRPAKKGIRIMPEIIQPQLKK